MLAGAAAVAGVAVLARVARLAGAAAPGLVAMLAPARIRSVTACVALVVGAATAGFGYAAWRADIRLADALAASLEGVDLHVTGIVDELPQPVERGVRFAFAVEATDPPGLQVPGRAFARVVCAGASRTPSCRSCMPASAGGSPCASSVRMAT